MKKFVYIAAAALLCVSCFHINSNFRGLMKSAIKGEGPVVSKTLDLKDFNAIQVNGHADIEFAQADDWEVMLTTQENIFDSLDYHVKDSVLVIQLKDHRTVNAEKYDLTIQAPSLNKVEINGAAEFKVDAPMKVDGDVKVDLNGAAELVFKGLTCNTLSLEVNGASDIDALDLDVKKLAVEINGAGDVEVSGKAGDASLEVNGAGDIDARKLTVASKLKKHTAGAARIQL